jgi:hypothetical protein
MPYISEQCSKLYVVDVLKEIRKQRNLDRTTLHSAAKG